MNPLSIAHPSIAINRPNGVRFQKHYCGFPLLQTTQVVGAMESLDESPSDSTDSVASVDGVDASWLPLSLIEGPFVAVGLHQFDVDSRGLLSSLPSTSSSPSSPRDDNDSFESTSYASSNRGSFKL
jgi:hypothetical protein